ncbi:IS630 family transposase [Roseomonas sp. KE2513]|uniref:IS630 family transposase n=1 Tax=Roseomonas sp. KE2513 TaxID=2479202 RepID=UPI0018DF0FC5|nr:IS630 family transposase [Roseomonas sp. KE2513]MBI0534381.1 IS630 family transposase [Roseomonas sp. KE2513]
MAEDPAAAPRGRRGGQDSLCKRGLRRAVAAVAANHPCQRIELWFQDEARVGQKGRTGHRWWARGQRPRGLCDQRHDWTYLDATVRPATGEGFALVLPVVSTTATSVFLEHLAATLAPDVHAVLVIDQAGWHGSRQLRVSNNVILIQLPPYAPELNPVERVWLHLRERFLSHRLLNSNAAIVDACCQA